MPKPNKFCFCRCHEGLGVHFNVGGKRGCLGSAAACDLMWTTSVTSTRTQTDQNLRSLIEANLYAGMPLLALPPEILLSVLQFVGANEFCEQLDRLLVCKRWYWFAQRVILEELQLSAKALKHFSPASVRLGDHLQANLKHLSIRLTGFEDWGSLKRPDDAEYIGYGNGQSHMDEWTNDLNKRLTSLAAMLPDFTKLRSVSFEAFHEFDAAHPYTPHRDYLWNVSVASLAAKVPTNRLTTLVLDTCGSSMISREKRGEQYEHAHICPVIAQHLVTLRRVRLRMRSICPDILRLSPDDGAVRIETLVINLSLQDPDGRTMAVRYARNCSSSVGREGWNLHTDLVKAAKSAATQMPKQRLLRVICHKVPSLQLAAVNCVTGTKALLVEGADWEDEGDSDPDDEPEEEVFASEGDSTSEASHD
ncbi:MAG: hypothetical protein M1830_008114 [Pleopsidium flavum]|nr:MAG: hypothetical protein M1830_008114 [Pleopsidium flavum]